MRHSALREHTKCRTMRASHHRSRAKSASTRSTHLRPPLCVQNGELLYGTSPKRPSGGSKRCTSQCLLAENGRKRSTPCLFSNRCVLRVPSPRCSLFVPIPARSCHGVPTGQRAPLANVPGARYRLGLLVPATDLPRQPVVEIFGRGGNRIDLKLYI